MTQEKNISEFKQIIWDYYSKNKREFPWREITDPYKIFISEVMLQQTQTHRVVPKYEAFIQEFPDFPTLAQAPFSQVLNLWSGLGYNRRAMYLQKSAQLIVQTFNNKLPADPEVLITLSGIGAATAASISVFAFNTPLAFIETNIRRVFIHFFYNQIIQNRHPGKRSASRIDSGHSPSAGSGRCQNDEQKVHDKDLLKLVEQTLDHANPREWYYALMDYGAALPKTIKNPNIKSAHYVKQSKFEGSIRQVRGQILRVLLDYKQLTPKQLKQLVKADKRFEQAFEQLRKERFLTIKNNIIELTP